MGRVIETSSSLDAGGEGDYKQFIIVEWKWKASKTSWGLRAGRGLNQRFLVWLLVGITTWEAFDKLLMPEFHLCRPEVSLAWGLFKNSDDSYVKPSGEKTAEAALRIVSEGTLGGGGGFMDCVGRWKGCHPMICILVTGRNHGATSYSKISWEKKMSLSFDYKVPVGHPDRIVQQVMRYN